MNESNTSPDPVVEIELCVTNEVYPFVGISGAVGCRMELQGLVTQTSGKFLQIYHADAPPSQVIEVATEQYELTAELLVDRSNGGLFAFQITNSDRSILDTFSDVGGLPRKMISESGEGRVVIDVLEPDNIQNILRGVTDETEGVDLVAKRRRSYSTPLILERQFHDALEGALTDRQQQVLQAAYVNGYFERPRERTGRELAAELGITQPTFSQHLRTAQQKVFSILFEEWLHESPDDQIDD